MKFKKMKRAQFALVGLEPVLAWSDLCSIQSMISPIAPLIETENASLLEIQPGHAKDVFDFASHEQVAKTVIWEAHRSVDDSAEYIRRTRDRFSARENSIFLCWAVQERESGKVIGLVSLTQLGAIRAQIGYVFHYQHWNTRLPVECIHAVTRFGFETFPVVERLQCRCFPTNHSSIHLLEKVGFQFEGVNHAMVKVRNQLQDLSCYAMTRKRWNGISDRDPAQTDFMEHI